MITRRELLRIGAGLTLCGQALTCLPAVTRGSLLILGGTGFIGPHLTAEALRQGWRVTHFNRGRHTGAASGVETLIGDRNGSLEALRGRSWDVVIDDTGFVPKFVQHSAGLLSPAVGHYLFISSVSVYASFARPNDEDSPTGQLSDPNIEQVTGSTYGPMKALCEAYTLKAFAKRCAIVRPGYIVGPLDPTDRFTYWPVRASRGGEMLAPGTPRDPIQVIDVRDLAAWLMRLAASRATGCYNAVSPPRAQSMGELIVASQSASPASGTRVTWVPEDFLAKQWKPDDLDLPPWAPTRGDSAGFALTDTRRAQRAGLTCRPLAATVHDTLAWFQSLPAERQARLHAGLDPKREADTLRAWHASA